MGMGKELRMSNGDVFDASPCDRCGTMVKRGHPVDSPMVPNWVCDDCLKDTDEVVDL